MGGEIKYGLRHSQPPSLICHDMADVCIIYSRDDAGHLPPVLENLLSPEFSIWWDKKIVHGDYREEILNELKVASCVVPIWSPALSGSMILDEAEHAKYFGVPLLPIITHDGPPPLGFGSVHMTKAIGWNGESDHPSLNELVDRIRHTIEQRPGPKLQPVGLTPTKAIRFPAYFFSLSSYETKIHPEQGIRALEALNVKSILVSAQDTATRSKRSRFTSALKRISRSDGFVLLDSGNYEEGRVSKLFASLKSPTDGAQRWSLDEYYAALENTPHNMAFCFDAVKPPPNNLDKVVANAVNAVKRDRGHTDRPVLPIIHLPCDRQGKFLVDLAPQAMVRVAKSLQPPMIGVPERELGIGIVARTATMKNIRTAFNELHHYQPVHVLGTGDPISIALLSAAGADSFDGLEWCRFALDKDQARLYPIQDYDFFRWQDETSPFAAAISANDGNQQLTLLGQMAVHNIDFYLSWIEELRDVLGDEKRLVEFMTNLLPKGGMSDIWDVLWNNSP